MTPALALRQVSKSFGGVQALQAVDFAVAAGSVHALLGENGAGKSTLMHIAYGMVAADAGSIAVRGEPATIHSPRDARRLGIGMVHQHFTSVESMTVRENVQLVIGGAGGQRGRGAEGTLATSASLSPLTSFPLDPDSRVETLSVAQKQRLEIVKALSTGARILLLDEPSAVLAPPEIEELLPMLRRFADDGGAVVLITHKLAEVLAVADQVTVLRQGRVVLEGAVAGRSREELAEAMVGGAAGQGGRGAGGPGMGERAGRREKGEEQGLGAGDWGLGKNGHVLVEGPGFEVRAGEVVGIAAVEGNGQRSILRAVAGLEHRPDIRVHGTVAFVPEDRSTEGLVGELTLTENLVLGLGAGAPWVRGALVDWDAARARTAELLAEHDVRATGADGEAGSLSGGNQQKLVMARAFEGHPEVLVAENPTRGLDIRATAEVHRRLREAARRGMGVLVWSSDLDEVLELADRVLVVHAGVVSAVPADADRAQVGRMMLRVREGEARSGKGEGGVSGER